MDKKMFIDTFHMNEQNGQPIYEQLIAYFRHMIQSGELKVGEKLITEGEICELLEISRTTVRQSMDKLVGDGLIVRQRGRGSFVADSKLQRPINYLYNFTENMNKLGVTPSSIILKSSVDFVNDSVREKLSLPLSQDKVFHLTRLRCADQEPMLFEDTFIPYYFCDGIEKVDFSFTSLYQTLKQSYSLDLYHATETIEAIIISEAEAALLKCKPKIAGYKITRISHLISGYAFEYTTSITRADRCSYQLELYNDKDPSKSSMNLQRNAVI